MSKDLAFTEHEAPLRLPPRRYLAARRTLPTAHRVRVAGDRDAPLRRLLRGAVPCQASGSTSGEIRDLFTGAMTRAAREQKLGRKGVSNSWEFWQQDNEQTAITGGNGGDAEEEEAE
ncbi:MAG: hypothetical protein LBE84_03565 [Planctomycetota bacterium]|nr:hypothetical protein [Planctomycetota bacterium]